MSNITDTNLQADKIDLRRRAILTLAAAKEREARCAHRMATVTDGRHTWHTTNPDFVPRATEDNRPAIREPEIYAAMPDEFTGKVLKNHLAASFGLKGKELDYRASSIYCSWIRSGHLRRVSTGHFAKIK